MVNFATMLCAILEPEQNRLLYASAGHQPPILLRDGETQSLELGGLPLVISPDSHYPLRRVELAPGDALIMYTDGTTDAINADVEMFGAERLETVASQHSGRSAGDLLAAILKAVREFIGDAPQSDDITVLVLRRHRA